MADISRIASPMSLCEEDLFDVNKVVDKKKKELAELQQKPASFFIGSIDVVNERISNLDSELSIYDSRLAIESQSSYSDDIYDPNAGGHGRRRTPKRPSRSARAREESDARKFEGVLSGEFDFLPEVKSPKKRLFPKKSDEPQLVELQQYPGFDPTLPTPLPHSLEAGNVLDHVVEAQKDLRRKPGYKQEVVKILFSKTQRMLLQDAFWWFFLNRFHPDHLTQSKLFKRIARKFVALLLMPIDPKYKNVFFMSYGSFLAQSVYSAFCLAFPQSWRQFDDALFKETVLSTCSMWVSGVPPCIGSFEKWNYPALEPTGMRKDESMNSSGASTEKGRIALSGKLSPSSSNTSVKTTTGRQKRDSIRGTRRFSATRSDTTSRLSSQRGKTNETSDRTLSPITEVMVDEEASISKPIRRKKLQSCAAGRSIEFDRCVFNIHGGSPLLNEFLHQRKLERCTGNDQLVKRTQIESFALPNQPTFREILRKSKKDIEKASAEFKRLYTYREKTCHDFEVKQAEEHRVYQTKTHKILTNYKQVHQLSNLIMMELKRDTEELNLVGATAAIQAALAAEAAN